MNKTVNINLAGIFFHIDEDAYLKLQRYLEAIKRSFTDSQGRNEIIADIEARIAELFSERVQNEKQVVSVKEVEEVITIMGQPEDYMVDEEIFEDEPKQSYSRPKSSPHKRMFRDTDSAYIGGVSSGLSHYFGIDALWIRLIWVALVFGAGTGILLYILLWILMPAAESTADKLAMSGKPVNITNIEEKVKEGFSNVKESLGEVADKVKNSDYNKVGDRVKDTSRSFFDALGNFIVFCFKIFAKFIGVIMIIVGASVLISLFVSLLSVGTSSLFDPWWMDYAHVGNSTDSPIWLVMLITFFAVGIPFFFVFLLGLKILVINLKPIGKIAGFTLLGVWLASIIALSVMAVDSITQHATDGSVIDRIELPIKSGDTLRVRMQDNDFYVKSSYRSRDFRIVNDESDNKMIYSSDVRLIFRSTKDSIGSMTVDKNAEGSTYQRAKETAGKIDYNYSVNANEVVFDSYLLTDIENKFRDQEVIVTIYLPEGSVLYANDNTDYFHRNWRYSNDILKHGMEEHYLKVIEDDVICLDCPEKNIEIKANINDTSIKIDENGASFKGESIEATIDSSGVSIETRDN
jgi:phage shock protein PspC (stress-responsive transcriptional regulator)